MLAATTRFLLGQRLVKRLCPLCRKPHRDSAALVGQYGDIVEFARGPGLAQSASGPACFFEAGGGCGACNRSGFSGRSGIFEFRDIRSDVADLLLRDRTRFDPIAAEAVFSESAAKGNFAARSMRQDGILKASLGVTTPEEVFGATMEAVSSAQISP
jgi:type II secretory ATPase GspE/PulE/Tfp pilus assembly ATPase PilB-like protein